MSKRWLNNFIAACIVLLIWAVMMLTLTGCGGGKGLRIEVETSGQGEDAEKKVLIVTDYQIENGFEVERDGDGYKVKLGSATTKDSTSGLLPQLLGMMQMMMYQNMGIPMPVPQATPVPDADGADLFKAGVEEGMRRQTELFNRSDRE